MVSRIKSIAGTIGLLASMTACTVSSYHVPPNLIIDPARTPRVKLDGDTRHSDTSVQNGASGQTLPVNRQTIAEKFLEAYQASYVDDGEASKARLLTRYGMTVIDTRCDLFFEQIGRGAQTGDFTRREFQSLSAALIAALGLTNIAKDAITGVGIGSALGLQSIDNYTTVYFFSPDVSSVQQLVRRAFSALRAELLSPERSPRDFDAAMGALRTYQNTCTAHEIKRLVTEAIDKGQTVAQVGTNDVAMYGEARDRALGEIRTTLGVDNVDLRQAVLLEMLAGGTSSEIEIDYLCASLSETVRAKACVATRHRVGGIEVDGFIVADMLKDPDTLATLKADWTTLRVLLDKTYPAERSAQDIAMKTAAPIYRDKAKAIAAATAARRQASIDRANARLSDAQREAAERKFAEETAKLKAAELAREATLKASTAASRQANETTQVIGVDVTRSSAPTTP